MPRGRPVKRNDDVLLKSAELIGWALGGLEREIAQTRERLATLTTQATRLREQLGRRASKSVAAVVSDTEAGETEGRPVQRRRKMSAEAKKRISEMMKKRWAERKKRGLKAL